MTMYAQFARHHAYARRNGYKGSYDEYVAGLFKAYQDTCKRCDVRKMMTKDEWLAAQTA